MDPSTIGLVFAGLAGAAGLAELVRRLTVVKAALKKPEIKKTVSVPDLPSPRDAIAGVAATPGKVSMALTVGPQSNVRSTARPRVLPPVKLDTAEFAAQRAASVIQWYRIKVAHEGESRHAKAKLQDKIESLLNAPGATTLDYRVGLFRSALDMMGATDDERALVEAALDGKA
jgi:hypothetical protein